jgi:hypothetical protein
MPGAVESLLSLAGLGFDDEPTSTTTAVPAGAATTRSVVTSLGRAETTTTAVADREKEVVTTLTERTTRTTEAGETRSSVIGPVENTAARTSCEWLSGEVWVGVDFGGTGVLMWVSAFGRSDEHL